MTLIIQCLLRSRGLNGESDLDPGFSPPNKCVHLNLSVTPFLIARMTSALPNIANLICFILSSTKVKFDTLCKDI